MLRRHPGGPGAGRLALIALVPVVVGAGLWLVNGDGGAPTTTRLEATQSSVDPLLGQALVGPWDAAGPQPAPAPAPAAVAPAAPGAEPALAESVTAAPGSGAASAGSPVPAPGPGVVIDRADSIDGGVDGGAGSTSEAEPAVSRGTGAATSSADMSGGATSAPSAPSTGERSTTPEPTTTSTPTTQATTTTTSPPAPAPSTLGSRNAAAEADVVPLTNRDRVAAGLGSLSRNACLDAAASGFAEQMARSGVLAHNSGAGAAVAGCRTNPSWGDNVGTAKPCDTALLEEEWMDSPSHRRNILTGAFTLIGVGAWTDDKGACWVQVLFSS